MLFSWLSVAVIKHFDQKQLRGGMGFIWLIVLGYSLSLRKIRAGNQAAIMEDEARKMAQWLLF